jgi:glycosyltransferase involved in cell wall biosynthesis
MDMADKSVLLVVPYFPPDIGGVEQYVNNLGKMLHQRHGWRVVVVATNRQLGQKETMSDLGPIRLYRLPAHFRLSNTPIGLHWRARIRAIIARESIGLVNAHAPVPLLADVAAQACGSLPFVLTYHTGPMVKGKIVADLTCAAYERLLLPATARRADEIIVSSDYVADCFPEIFKGRSTTISPGVDTTLFHAGGIPEPELILFVSSLAKAASYKGLPDLLQAFVGLRRDRPLARLTIVGDGDGFAEYIERCRHLGVTDQVTFTGQLDRAELARAYRKATLVALPTHYDSFPTVLVEAMATGRPVVSTTVGGVPSLVRHGIDGILVPPGHVSALTSAINQLLSEPEAAARMGRAGHVRVTGSLSWETQASRTDEVFERALTARGPFRKKTVAVVAPFYPPRVGGVENYAERIAQEINKSADLRPVVITSNVRPRTEVELRDGIPVVRLSTWFTISNTPMNPLWFITVRRLLKHYRVGLVNTHAPVPGLADVATLVAGTRPVVQTYHSGSMVKHKGHADWMIKLYEKYVLARLFRRAAAVVAVSPASLAHDVPNSRIITPGVDTDVFTPSQLSNAPDATLLYVGRLDRTSAWKGVDVLLRAFALIQEDVPAAGLRLVGSGSSVDDLRQLATSLGIANKVEFSGQLTGDDLVEAYRRARALVLPSVTEAESFGMTLIEAMACGRPVIGSDIGGIPYVIDHEQNGLLVPPRDVPALASACRRLLQDDALCARLGQNGRRSTETIYAWPKLMVNYQQLFLEILFPTSPGLNGHHDPMSANFPKI